MKEINKKGWTKVSFGEVCKNLNQTETEALAKGIERYIGLEHIESGNLHISNWGNVADGTTFTKKFSKGHVLFGKRRAYLKKAAVAKFDGICSGDILVLEANEKVINKNLFPFLVSSDRFFEHAVQTSAGSLSPRTKFQDLAKFEFLLPPKEQQAKLAELLWAGDHLTEQYSKEKIKIELISRTFVQSALRKSSNKKIKLIKQEIPTEFQTSNVITELPSNWKILSLNEVIENSQNGFAEGGRSAEDGVWQLRMNNVTKDCTLDLTDVIRVPKERNLTRYQIEVGDVLFNNTNSEELVGKTVYFETIDREMVFSNHFTRLRAKPKYLLQKYLQIWLKYHFKIGLFQRRCTKWIGQAAIQNENLLSLKILLPTIEEQKEIIKVVTSFESNTNILDNMIVNSNLIQKQLINQVFG